MTDNINAVASIANSVLSELKKRPCIGLLVFDCKDRSSFSSCVDLSYKFMEVIDGYWSRHYVNKAMEHNLTFSREDHITNIRSPCQIVVIALNCGSKDRVVSDAEVQSLIDLDALRTKFKAEGFKRFIDSKYGKKRVQAFCPLLCKCSTSKDVSTKVRASISEAWSKRVSIPDLERNGGLSSREPSSVEGPSNPAMSRRSSCTIL